MNQWGIKWKERHLDNNMHDEVGVVQEVTW